MRNHRRHPPAFTLLELIFVMVILAIAAAMVAPSLHTFAVGRQTDNAVTTVLALANYAREHSIQEGRVYRLNFDTHTNMLNLTVQNNGVFEAPKNDFGGNFSMPDGVKLDVNVTPQPQLLPAVQQQQQSAAQTAVQPTMPYGQPLAQQNNLVPNPRDNGVYIEFQPTGRVDPVLVKLTDKLGKLIEIGCQTSTETLHVLGKSEMQ